MTRFKNAFGRGARPLSFVGVGRAEMRGVLDQLLAAAAPAAVVVMHSNEFVRTEMLSDGRLPEARQLVRRRYESFCAYLAQHPQRYSTCFVDERVQVCGPHSAIAPLAVSRTLDTAVRLGEQVLSRWL